MDEPDPASEPAPEVLAEPTPEAAPAAEISAPLEAAPLTGPAAPVPEASPTEVPAVETIAPSPEVVAETPSIEVAPETNTGSVPTALPPAPPEPAQPTSPSQPSSVPQTHSAKNDSMKGNATKKQKVEAHLTKILSAAREKKTISNKDVVKLLRVSDATASRYLKILVSRGQLQKTGKGRAVVYTLAWVTAI